jgi:hypothetical protein
MSENTERTVADKVVLHAGRVLGTQAIMSAPQAIISAPTIGGLLGPIGVILCGLVMILNSYRSED